MLSEINPESKPGRKDRVSVKSSLQGRIKTPAPVDMLDENERDPREVYELVHDEMFFDANPRLNMASFVNTWMEPEAEKLMTECFNKNFIDKPIYPQTIELQDRCVGILSNLFHADIGKTPMGTATVGSSEAIHLAGLALKWRWKKWAEGVSAPKNLAQPNIVMGSNVQVCWLKFAKYFDVELIEVPVDENNRLDIDAVIKRVNDSTIAVVGILGNTYSGEFDNIERLNNALMKRNEQSAWKIPIHVDAASGGFIAPFTNVHENIIWDFRLPLVQSINVSGHKYGLVYPGIGWAIWRNSDCVPPELIFRIEYLGEKQKDFGLNFSRGSSQVIAQYYNFVRLGRSGYKKIMDSLMAVYDQLKTAMDNAAAPDNKKLFKLVSHDCGLPLVCVTLNDGLPFNLSRLSHKAKEKGWILPVYPLSEPHTGTEVMRMVIREGFSPEMCQQLITDLDWAVGELYKDTAGSNMLTHGARGVC